MLLELRNVSKKVGQDFHISNVSLTFDAGIQGECCPKLNKQQDPSYWFNLPGSPKAKLANEKPQGMTVDYDELVKSWAAATKNKHHLFTCLFRGDDTWLRTY